MRRYTLHSVSYRINTKHRAVRSSGSSVYIKIFSNILTKIHSPASIHAILQSISPEEAVSALI